MFRSRLKSKTGCLICRARKKKCDEQKPVCTSCARLGLVCKWAPPEALHQRSHVPSRLCAQASKGDLLPLEYFYTVTLRTLAEYDSSVIWEQTLGYLCQNDSAIKGLAVAFSDQHRISVHDAWQQHAIANRSYLRALALWRIRLADFTIDDTPTIVIGCLILAITESLRSTPDAFLVHLRHATRIANNAASTPKASIIKQCGRFLGILQSLCASTWLYYTSPLCHGDYSTISDIYLDANVEILLDGSNDNQFELCSLSMLLMQSRRATAMEASPTQQTSGASVYTNLQRKASELTSKLNADARPRDCPSLLSNRAGVIILTQFLHYPQPYNTALGPPPSIVEPVLELLEEMADSIDGRLGQAASPFSAGTGLTQLATMCLTTTTNDLLRTRALSVLKRCPAREGLWVTEHLLRAWHEYSQKRP